VFGSRQNSFLKGQTKNVPKKFRECKQHGIALKEKNQQLMFAQQKSERR